MGNSMSVLLKNNLIAIVIHICMCFVFLYPSGFISWMSVWGSGALETKDIVIMSLIVIGYTIIIFLVYFHLGKRFLISTNNIYSNALSVAVLLIIILMITFSAYDEIAEQLIRIPFYPLGETIAFALKTGEKNTLLVISILPSFTMWVGLNKKGQVKTETKIIRFVRKILIKIMLKGAKQDDFR